MGRSREKFIDWARNNKVAIRNFSEACDFHDIVKLLIVKMQRRKYQVSNLVPIYTEYNVGEDNDYYPDIQMIIKGEVYVWEIQEKITEAWKKQIVKKHEDVNLIIVPLEKLDRTNITKLKNQLKDYII